MYTCGYAQLNIVLVCKYLEGHLSWASVKKSEQMKVRVLESLPGALLLVPTYGMPVIVPIPLVSTSFSSHGVAKHSQ